MIYINECKRHNTNTFGLLKRQHVKSYQNITEFNVFVLLVLPSLWKNVTWESSNHNGRTSSVVTGIITLEKHRVF